MPPSRAEYIAYQESLGTQHKPALDVALGMIKTAAVSFDHLTNDPNWDRFLSYVQAQLEAAKKERDLSLSYCGGAVGDALVKAQLQYQHHSGYIKALEAIIGLPSQLRSAYEDVRATEAVPSSP